MADLQNTYRIVGAELTEFELQPEGKSALGVGSSVDYDVSIEVMLSKEDKLLHFRTSITMRKKEEAAVHASAHAVVVFQLFEMEKHVELQEPDQFTIEPNVNISMGRVSIGYARGALQAQLKQHGIINIVLPMLPFEY